MEVPASFEDGFNLRSLVGALFIAFVMVPGAIYMRLLAGQGIGPAAQWVTVVLFLEAARRAHQSLSRAELYVLFYLAGAVMAVPFTGPLWRQFFVQSNAARAAGIAENLPAWYAPSDPDILGQRNFFLPEWWIPLGLIIFMMFMGKLNQLILGYGLFHIASDIERLPFPMAPIRAMGITALAEDSEKKDDSEKQKSWRWRVFSMGSGIGMLFGLFYLGLPTISGAFLKKPLMIFPIPFVDFTTRTGSFLPAVATGLSWDLGQLLFGMVMPFGAMLGSFVGLLSASALNIVLYKNGLLPSWVLGDSLVVTAFKNRMDFYFSFSIGVSLAIAAAGIFQIVRKLRAQRRTRDAEEGRGLSREARREALKQRGEIPMFWVVAAYIFTTTTYILVSGKLLNWHRGALIVFSIIGFVYAPVITYARVRLEGMVGQTIHVPMVMEAARILSRFQGAEIWFVPTPQAEIKTFAARYREAELTGTSFKSIWKAQIFLMPIVIFGTLFFANFIWSMSPVPSARFPFTEKMWELNAMTRCIMYTSTMGGFSQFEQAFKVWVLFSGLGVGLVALTFFGALGLPSMFIYGAVRGLDQTLPYIVVPQFIGAMLGRYYFRPRFKEKWRQYIPVVAAGYGCGAGLITVLGVGFTFLKNAVIQLPY